MCGIVGALVYTTNTQNSVEIGQTGQVKETTMQGKSENKARNEQDSLEYFDIQAAVGTTKHMGGLVTTRELIRMCKVKPSFRVLDVGSGSGATACYLAENVGCEVVGLDLHPEMVALGRARAKRKGLEEKTSFHQGDIQAPGFGAETFDVVFCESVLSFVENKQAALNACWSMLKPGGVIGLNEEVWLQKPSEEKLKGAVKLWGLPEESLQFEDWKHMLQEAGFSDVHAEPKRMKVLREASQVLRYSPGDMFGMFGTALCKYVRDPAFREYMRERKKLPRGIFKMLAYGLYCGKKPDSASG